jgi:acetyl-CoA carboxylase biotin carboxyl carrier protein
MSEKKGGSGVIDPEFVRELAAILTEQSLTEIELEQGDLRLRLAKIAPAVTMMAAAPSAPASFAPAPAAAAVPVGLPPGPSVAPEANHPGAVRSPMVGTAYLSSEPGAAAFVRVGDTVAAGQTLLIVEAMKTFNPIPAPRAGKVKQILVSDAQPVEYDEPLVIVE